MGGDSSIRLRSTRPLVSPGVTSHASSRARTVARAIQATVGFEHTVVAALATADLPVVVARQLLTDPRFSREGVAPPYFLLRRFFCGRRAFDGCKRL
jgi:hypothetical protein